jgi:hypothetical protein
MNSRDLKSRPNFLDLQRIDALRRGARLGMAIGALVGLGLGLILHVTLASFARTTHETAVASIKQADRILMNECESIVVELAEEQYQTVRDYRREVGRLQGVAK